MSLATPDYSKTIMYKIISKNKLIPDTYIGHTTNIQKRKRQHRENVIYPNLRKDYCVYKFIRENGGWENFELLIIEEYPCNTCDEARLRERYWYELLKPSLNDRKPISSKKEYCVLNKDKKQDYDRLYREKNKELIKERKKKYWEANKEKINEKRRLKTTSK